jgi:hypothetical protein
MHLYPEENFTTPPEYALWQDSIIEGTLPVNVSKKLLNGTFGLFDIENVKLFFTDVVQDALGNWTIVKDRWGISKLEAIGFVEYFLITYKKVSPLKLEALFKQGGGLITKRTVQQWMFTAVDPVLQLVQPQNADVSLVGNYTSENDCLTRGKPQAEYTGKNDLSQLQQFYLFDGETHFDDVFCAPIQVMGGTEDGQFKPFLDNYTPLLVWNDDMYHAINLVPMGNITVHGIVLNRYMIDNATFGIDPHYCQEIEGFSNLTLYKQSPIFLSYPYFLLAYPKWRNSVSGLKEPNTNNSLTFVDVEPTLGKVLQVYKSLQINLYVADKKPFNFFNKDFKTGVMYPLTWGYQFEEITEDLANQVKAVFLGQNIQQKMPMYAIPIALFLLLIGSLFGIVLGCMNYRFVKEQYEEIQ